MEAKTLSAIWGAPDNTRLTAKQSSFRLPVHVAAKLAALAEMYPQKSKTQTIGDLLAAAIAEMEKGLKSFPGEYWQTDEHDGELYWAVGPAQDFRTLSNKHYKELEKELGNESPEVLFTPLVVGKDAE